jgi:hypothetical protein
MRAWMRVEMVTMAVSAFGCMVEAQGAKRFPPILPDLRPLLPFPHSLLLSLSI